jgi:hypothetical protein
MAAVSWQQCDRPISPNSRSISPARAMLGWSKEEEGVNGASHRTRGQVGQAGAFPFRRWPPSVDIAPMALDALSAFERSLPAFEAPPAPTGVSATKPEERVAPPPLPPSTNATRGDNAVKKRAPLVVIALVVLAPLILGLVLVGLIQVPWAIVELSQHKADRDGEEGPIMTQVTPKNTR